MRFIKNVLCEILEFVTLNLHEYNKPYLTPEHFKMDLKQMILSIDSFIDEKKACEFKEYYGHGFFTDENEKLDKVSKIVLVIFVDRYIDMHFYTIMNYPHFKQKMWKILQEKDISKDFFFMIVNKFRKYYNEDNEYSSKYQS